LPFIWAQQNDHAEKKLIPPPSPPPSPATAAALRSSEGPRGTPEIFAAPLPPEKGRIIAVDCHPDIFTAAVFQGTTPHNARKLAVRENLSLEALLTWVSREFTRENLFLMEAGSNSFEICRRLQACFLCSPPVQIPFGSRRVGGTAVRRRRRRSFTPAPGGWSRNCGS